MDEFQKIWLKQNARLCVEVQLANLGFNYIFRYIVLFISIAAFFSLHTESQFVDISFWAFSLFFVLSCVAHVVFFVDVFFGLSCEGDLIRENSMDQLRKAHFAWSQSFAAIIKYRPGIFQRIFYGASFVLMYFSSNFTERLLMIFISYFALNVIQYICYILCLRFVRNHVNPISIAMIENRSYRKEVETV